jgi:hypothetical protein
VAAHLAYTVATPYLTLTPGKHNFSAMRPGSTAPLLSVTGATLQSGVAYSAVVLGTRGQMTRVLLLADRGAPGIKPASATTPPKNGQPPAAGGPGGGSGDTVTIRTGDCLWMIAQDVVGKDASGEQVQQEVVRIWKANADRIGTGDPDLVYPGVKLRIPKP